MNPFLLPRPGVISFSGGRTSGLMLRKVIDAYGGTLPHDVRAIFANTGKERLETLDFVERVSIEWDVPITWIEFDNAAPHKYREVNYANASRNGEPFEALIRSKQHLPNVKQRYCTSWLKIKPVNRFIRHELGWGPIKKKGRVVGGGYDSCIGLRWDEPNRVAKLRDSIARYPKHLTVKGLFGKERIKNPKWRGPPPPGERPSAPMAIARMTIEHVSAFWKDQRCGLELETWLSLPAAERPGWDLALRPDEGNCDLCFLKGETKLANLIRAKPDSAEWWDAMETQTAKAARKPDGARFNKRISVALIREAAARPGQPVFPGEEYAPACAYACTD